MPRRPKRLQQHSWDGSDPKYADISAPEWVTSAHVPNHFWDDPFNHRRYIEWLSRELGISKLDDWYQIRQSDFMSRRGVGFIEHYGNSHIRAITTLYPNHDWKIWLFTQVPNGFWDDICNIRAYIKWFEKQFGITKMEDWYAVQQDDVYEHCGSGLISRYASSVPRLLAVAYPDFDWKPWRFTQTASHFWWEKSNCVAYLRWLAKELNLKSPEGWYRVRREDFVKYHGGSLFVVSGLTLLEILRDLHPDFEWLEWRFMQVPAGFWDSPSNRIRYLKWLGKQLGYTKKSDWYQIKNKDFHRFDGGTLIEFVFKRDVIAVLKELYPKSNWLEWKFHAVPTGFWDEPKNCKKYLRWFAKRVGIKRKSDWYRISNDDFKSNLGSGFMKRFRTPYGALSFAYPNLTWLPWLFDRIPYGFWDDRSNREQYLRWVGKQLKFKSASDWQRLTADLLRTMRGGYGLLATIGVPRIRKEGRATFRKSPTPNPKS